MTFSAGRRRVASPFAQRAAQHAENSVDLTDTPDISTIPDPFEPNSEAPASDAPEILEEHPKAEGESTVEEVANDASDEAQEPTSEAVETEQPVEADDSDTKPARGRGRPRVAEVKERDDKIFDAIAVEPGHTRATLEVKLDMTQNEVYMSLFRLRTAGKIEKRRIDGKHAWFAVEAEAVTTEA